MAESSENLYIDIETEFPDTREYYEQLLSNKPYSPQTLVDNAIVAVGHAARNNIAPDASHVFLYSSLVKRSRGRMDTAVQSGDINIANPAVASVHSALLLADEMDSEDIAEDDGARIDDAEFHLLEALSVRELLKWSSGPEAESCLDPRLFTDALMGTIDDYKLRPDSPDVSFQDLHDILENKGDIYIEQGLDHSNKRLLRLGSNALRTSLFIRREAELDCATDDENIDAINSMIETAEAEIKRVH